MKVYGILRSFEEKVRDFSDVLLANQLHVYMKLVGDKSPDDMKFKLQVLKAEYNRRRKS